MSLQSFSFKPTTKLLSRVFWLKMWCHNWDFIRFTQLAALQLSVCVSECELSSVSRGLTLFLFGRPGGAGWGHCLRGVFEKCISAVGYKKYERGPKSRHRGSWIMSAAKLKKRDGTICSSIWMANWLTLLLTQAEQVWRGCEDERCDSPHSLETRCSQKWANPNQCTLHLSLWRFYNIAQWECFCAL